MEMVVLLLEHGADINKADKVVILKTLTWLWFYSSCCHTITTGKECSLEL